MRGRLEVHARHNLRGVQSILGLAQRYDVARLERAIESGDGRYRAVRGILERGLDRLIPEEPTLPVIAGAFLRCPSAFVSERKTR